MKSVAMYKSQPPKPKVVATIKKIMVDSKTGKSVAGKEKPMSMKPISQNDFFSDGKKNRSQYVSKGSVTFGGRRK